jgi:hypothetical protein
MKEGRRALARFFTLLWGRWSFEIASEESEVGIVIASLVLPIPSEWFSYGQEVPLTAAPLI